MSETLQNSPPQLWKKGEKDGYSTIVLNVRVCQGPHGEIWSIHDFETPEDAALALKWSGGGVRQIAHALLTEALRRESFVSSMVKMSSDKDFLPGYARASQEAKALFEKDFAQKVLNQFAGTAGKIVLACSREILAMLIRQKKEPPVE